MSSRPLTVSNRTFRLFALLMMASMLWAWVLAAWVGWTALGWQVVLVVIALAAAVSGEIRDARNRHPSQRSNDAPSTGATPALIRTQHTNDGGQERA